MQWCYPIVKYHKIIRVSHQIVSKMTLGFSLSNIILNYFREKYLSIFFYLKKNIIRIFFLIKIIRKIDFFNYYIKIYKKNFN